MHTALPHEVFHGIVLELCAVVRQEDFRATESEEDLLTQFRYHRLGVCLADGRCLYPPDEKVLERQDVLATFGASRQRSDDVCSHDARVC